MLRYAIALPAALLVLLLAGLIPALSQDMGEDGDAEQPKDPMAAWMELQQPGAEHKLLAESVGEWVITGKMYHMEGAKVVESDITGTASIKMLWDRYMQEDMVIDCPVQKMKMHMRGYIGYDNSAKEFRASYFGDMGTSLMVMSGQADMEARTMTFTGEWVEKGMGNMKRKSRVVSTEKSKDESTVAIYETYGDAPEFKMMEMTYKRKK